MKKTLSLIILAVLALSTSVFATDDSGNVAHSAHALWTESFDSAAEMAQSAYKDVSNPSYDTVMSRFFDDVVNSGYTSPRDADFNGLKTLYKK